MSAADERRNDFFQNQFFRRRGPAELSHHARARRFRMILKHVRSSSFIQMNRAIVEIWQGMVFTDEFTRRRLILNGKGRRRVHLRLSIYLQQLASFGIDNRAECAETLG